MQRIESRRLFFMALQVFSVYSVFGLSNLNTEASQKCEERGEAFVRLCWRGDTCKFIFED
jgi:hypothetical protein